MIIKKVRKVRRSQISNSTYFDDVVRILRTHGTFNSVLDHLNRRPVVALACCLMRVTNDDVVSLNNWNIINDKLIVFFEYRFFCVKYGV